MIKDSRIICCLETWIKEIQEDPDINEKTHPGYDWIINTYIEEIKDGYYVDDDEYNEWLLNRYSV